jgi:NTE family protein
MAGLPNRWRVLGERIRLANVSTRLKRLEPATQQRLINCGFAVCDTAMRRHVDTSLATPDGFPYAQVGVG